MRIVPPKVKSGDSHWYMHGIMEIIYVVMISFSIANLFLPVLKTIKSVLPIPFCFRIICYVYRIATLVLPSESRAIDFLLGNDCFCFCEQ